MELILDTVSSELTVLLLDEGELCFKLREVSRSASHSFLKDLQGFFEQRGLSTRDVKTLYFNRGPGSFTGIKLGSVVSSTWAFDSDLELRGYHAFHLMQLNEYFRKDLPLYQYAYQEEYFEATFLKKDCFEVKVLHSSEIDETRGLYYGKERFCREEWQPIELPDLESFQKLPSLLSGENDLEPLYIKKSNAQRVKENHKPIIRI